MKEPLRVGQQAGGTHLTGMHSCPSYKCNKSCLTSRQCLPASDDLNTLTSVDTFWPTFPVARTKPTADSLDKMGIMRYNGYNCWNFCVRCRLHDDLWN